MPPKTFVCSICGKIVSKPKSYALVDGKRACREHEESQTDHKKLEEAKKKEIKSLEDIKNQRDEWRRKNNDFRSGPVCFCCYEDGMMAREFYSKILLSHEVGEVLKGSPINIFKGEGIVRGVAPDKMLLTFVEIPERLVSRLYNRSTMDAARLMNCVVPLCNKCIAKLKIVPPPERTFDQLVNIGFVYETFVRPQVKKVAEKIVYGEDDETT